MSIKLAIANIGLNTSSVSQQGFGTILFIGKHNYFQERIKAFPSLTAMSDEGIPTSSALYRAAQGAFSQTTAPSFLKFGRQEVKSILTIDTPAIGSVHSISIANDNATVLDFSYTAAAGNTEETVVDALMTAINAQTDLAASITLTKVGATATAQLTIDQKVAGANWFVTSKLVGMTETFTSTESAADTMNAIVDEDDAFYNVTAEERDATFVKALAADIEGRMKFYRTSTDEASHYAATPSGAVADLQASNYFRSSGFYHHESVVSFPEVASLAEIAFAVTGNVTYANRQVAAISPSLNASGFPLTATQRINLTKVNIDYFARVGTASSDPIITVIGKTASGEYIDNIVGRDNMQVDLEASYTNFLINQKTSKITMNNKGANQLRGILRTVLNSYTVNGRHNFIEEGFEILIPDEADFSTVSRATRKFDQITFKARLTNAVHMVELTGSLSL